jgi:hypothetical protein
MAKPLIFTISAAWDGQAGVWTGHCDDIPAAADAPTLDELQAKISAMTLDLLPAICRLPRCAKLSLPLPMRAWTDEIESQA